MSQSRHEKISTDLFEAGNLTGASEIRAQSLDLDFRLSACKTAHWASDLVSSAAFAFTPSY